MLNELIKKHDGWISSSVFPELDRKGVHEVLRALRFAGLIELKRKNSDLLFCKSNIMDPETVQEQRNLRILPDFTVIIPQETDLENLFRFILLGTLNTFDRVYKGKIDKNVIGDAISCGIQGDTILQWLSVWQAPGNVIETVREWLREFYRLYITGRSVLVSNDEKVTFQINSYEPLSSLVEPVQANALYLIKQGQESRVREILQNLGFDYRMPGQNLGVSESEDKYLPENTEIERWTVVVKPEAALGEAPVNMRGTKYGGELKSLESNEILHVIDYAILTGQRIDIRI